MIAHAEAPVTIAAATNLGASVPRVLSRRNAAGRASFNISVKKPRGLAAFLLKRSETSLGSGPVRQ